MEDMMIWDRAFYDGANISQAMQREAYAPRSFEQKGNRNYGVRMEANEAAQRSGPRLS
jgi:hypothetical protein